MVAQITLEPASEAASGRDEVWCQVGERYVTAALQSGSFRKQHRRHRGVTAAATLGCQVIYRACRCRAGVFFVAIVFPHRPRYS
jgi:hypothetical protein